MFSDFAWRFLKDPENGSRHIKATGWPKKTPHPSPHVITARRKSEEGAGTRARERLRRRYDKCTRVPSCVDWSGRVAGWPGAVRFPLPLGASPLSWPSSARTPLRGWWTPGRSAAIARPADSSCAATSPAPELPADAKTKKNEKRNETLYEKKKNVVTISRGGGAADRRAIVRESGRWRRRKSTSRIRSRDIYRFAACFFFFFWHLKRLRACVRVWAVKKKKINDHSFWRFF